MLVNIMMKISIISVYFLLLAVTYSQSLLRCFKEIKSEMRKPNKKIRPPSEMDVFRAENSLVFITDKKDFLISGALVKKNCILTASGPLLQFMDKNETERKLFVGIGIEPSKRNLNAYLHPLDDRIHEFHRRCLASRAVNNLVLIMFEINKYGTPNHIRTISVSRANFTLGNQEVKAEAVGWGMDKKIRKFPVTQVYNENINHGRIQIHTNNEEINNHFIGGFITRNTNLEGIVYFYNNSRENMVTLKFEKLNIPNNFIKYLTNGNYNEEDILQEMYDVRSEASSPVSFE